VLLVTSEALELKVARNRHNYRYVKQGLKLSEAMDSFDEIQIQLAPKGLESPFGTIIPYSKN